MEGKKKGEESEEKRFDGIEPSDSSEKIPFKADGNLKDVPPRSHGWKIKTPEGEEEGPLELKEIREKIKAGEIGADTHVMGPKFIDWVPLRKVPQLSRFFAFQESIGTANRRGGSPPGRRGGVPGSPQGKDGNSKRRRIFVTGIILITLFLLFFFNPRGKVRFWERKAEDILTEVEELLEEEEIPKKEIPLEEVALEEEKEEPVTEITIPGEEVKKEAPDIFAEDIFALGVEKTDEEKRADEVQILLLKGKEAIEMGNFADAANIFTQVLKLEPENEEATNNMFLSLSNLRESEARANLSRTVASHFDKAKLLYEEKDYEESLKEFEKVLQLDPAHVIAEDYAEKIRDKLSGEEARRIEEERKKEEEARLKAEEERQKKLAEMRGKIPDMEKEMEKHFREKEYEKALEIATEILIVQPSNRTALGLLSRAKEEGRIEEEKITEAFARAEAEKRMLEVEKAAIPTVEEPELTTEKEGEVRKPRKVEKELISPRSKKLEAMKERAQQLVSLDFKDADLRDVMRFLVEQTQVNIVIDESVLREIGEPSAPSQPLMVPVFQTPFQTQTAPTGQEGEGYEPRPTQIVAQPQMLPQAPAYSEPYMLPAQSQLGLQAPEGESKLISPRVTIYLINVPLEKALEAVLRAKGLSYKIEEDIIWVSTKEKLKHEDMVVKVFTLKNAVGRFTSFPSGGLLGGGVGGGRGKEGGGAYGGSTGAETGEEELWLKEIGLAEEEEKEEREADIRDIIMEFVPQPEGSGIAYYERLNKLIVRNIPANIELVARILESLDISAYQVAIEARIVELSSFKGTDVGVSLEDILFEKGDRYSSRSISADVTHDSSTFGESDVISGGLELIFTTIDDLQYTAVIDALEKNKNANTLSAPKLTCMDNQTANIKVVKNYKYVSRWEYDTAGYDEYLREFWTPVIAELDEGIILEVTPHVNDENMTVTLIVKPAVSELVEFELIGDETYPNQLPITIQRTAETTVSMKNGRTLVMGGLMKSEDVANVRSIPLLGKIPVLGSLFRAKTQYVSKVNLIIFIKATIIDSEGRIVTEGAKAKEMEL